MNYTHLLKIIIIYIVLMSVVFTVLILIPKFKPTVDIKEVLLRDDGYYKYAGKLINDVSFKNKGSRVMNILTMLVYVVPVKFHFLSRFALSVIINIGSFSLFYLIGKHLKIQPIHYYFTVLFTMINPTFLHWTIRYSPEPCITFFMLLMVYLLIKGRYYIIPSIFIYVILLLTRQTVILIPVSLLVGSIFLKKKNLHVVSLILLFLSLGGYFLLNRASVDDANIDFRNEQRNRELNYSSGVSQLIKGSFFAKQVIISSRYETGAIKGENGNRYIAYKEANEWVSKNYKEGMSRFELFGRFILDYPYMYILSIVANSVFYFTLANTTSESYVQILFFLSTVIIFMFRIKEIKVNRNEIVMISVFVGVMLLHSMVYSYTRYGFNSIIMVNYFAFKGYKFKKMKQNIKIKNVKILKQK